MRAPGSQPCRILWWQLDKIALCGLIMGSSAVHAEASYAHEATTACAPGQRYVKFSTDEASIGGVDVSPDGKNLVFSLFGDIYVLPVKGGKARAITKGRGWDVSPVWAPDGRSIAFISDRDGDDQAYVLSYPGHSNVRKISDRTIYGGTEYEGVIRQVEWHPDSQSVVADGERLDVDGRSQRTEPPYGWQSHTSYYGNGAALYRFQSLEDGSSGGAYSISKQTADSPGWVGMEFSIDLGLDEAASPLISKDGRWLVYKDQRSEKVAGKDGSVGARYIDSIRIRDLSSGRERRLAGSGSIGWRNSVDPGFMELGRAAFSPESKFLYASYGRAIHRIDIGSGEDKRIPANVTIDQCLAPMLSFKQRIVDTPLIVRNMRDTARRPGGGQFVFSALRRLYVADSLSGDVLPLFPQETGQFQPAYSPDGKWIAFATWSEVNGGHIWRIPSSGDRAPERLTKRAGYYQSPAWSADGGTIAFVGSEGMPDRSSASSREPDGGSLRLISVGDGTERVLPVKAQMGRPLSFSLKGDRLSFMAYQAKNPRRNEVHSVLIGGDDERSEGIGKFLPLSSVGATVLAIPSPDGTMAAVTKFGNLFVLRCTQPIGSDEFKIEDCDELQVSRVGAYDPKWSHDGGTLEWTLGSSHYSASVADLAIRGGNEHALIPHDEALTISRRSLVLEQPRDVAEGSILLKNADIVTMRGDEVLRGGSVLVENGRITKVSASHIDVSPDVVVLDLRGKTILPGFIDAHAHFRGTRDMLSANEGSLLTYLAFGITTAKDPANGGDHLFTYEELIETGSTVGPRILSATALVNGTQKIESYEDALGVADRAIELGGTFLKYHTGWSRRQRQWIVEAARERQLNVAAHFTNVNYEFGRLDLSTIVDGVSSTEHGMHASVQTSELAEYIARSGVSINFASTAKNGGYANRFWDEAMKDERMLSFYNGSTPRKVDQIASVVDFHGLPPLSPGSESDVTLAASIGRAGGQIAVGSHGDIFGIGFHWEMWAYVHGGMTTHEALRAGTLNGAYSLGVESDLGSIEVGKVADLLILDKNPLDDIRNTTSISRVMKHGVMRDSKTLDEVWPEVKALPEWRFVEDKSL